MATKTFKVSLSLDNPRIIQSGITVQSFDKQSVKISIALTKDSQTYQIPIGATIRISLLKLSNQAQKIIVDVPNTNRESIDWIVPDYLDGYHGVVRCGVYLLNGTESVDLGYFTILSNVSDIDKMAEEFTDNVFNGWEQIEDELQELKVAIAEAKSDLSADMTQVDNTIANINAKNTQVNTLASDFTTDVATKQADVTSKYNAFDTSVTQAGQTIDDILGLADDVQQIGVELNEKANKTQEAWITPTLLNGWADHVVFGRLKYLKDAFGFVCIEGYLENGTSEIAFVLPIGYRPRNTIVTPVVGTFSNTMHRVAVRSNGEVVVPVGAKINFISRFNS